MEGIRCHICAGCTVKEIPSFRRLHRVTSDCRPWTAGGRLGYCRVCGCLQKVVDPVWHREVDQIYESYSIYQQSDGTEQVVFAPSSGQSAPRSARVLELWQASVEPPKRGRLLDIGCGNGAMLASFSALAPGWSLVGTELNDKYREQVERMADVEGLYTCAPQDVPGTFDLITMIHVFEHIVNPQEFLMSLRNKLVPGGLLIVELPNFQENPFDLLIADHCTHFTPDTLRRVIQCAGFEVTDLSTEWVPKELTVFARKAESATTQAPEAVGNPEAVVSVTLQWLAASVDTARQAATVGNFGLFGTSIAATWLLGELNDSVGFFVDEDPSRIGRSYMGRPVLHPRQVQEESRVFLALPKLIAQNVSDRMKSEGMVFECILPPSLPDVLSPKAWP